MTAYPAAIDRVAIYRRLAARNRVVGVLRVAVPILGALVLVGLVGQIYLSSMGSRFGVGRIAVTQEHVIIEAPEYEGMLDDGSHYRIAAASAAAALEATDMLDLSDVALTVTRPTGVATTLSAAAAQLDTSNEVVRIAGTTHIVESTGTTGRFDNSVFDWSAQTLTSEGPVSIDYSDGSHLVADGVVYDARALLWTFNRATVTLPSTPGAEHP